MLTNDPRFICMRRTARCLPPLASLVSLLTLPQGRRYISLTRWLWSVLLCLALLVRALPVQAASQLDLHGPPGSGAFGQSVTVLPNGNLVATDPLFSNGATQHVGAVYL